MVITARDLKRMKAPSMILTAQQVSAQRKAAEAERQKARVASDARKERMLRMEEERKKALPKSESEQLKAAEDQTTLSQADLLMQEEKASFQLLHSPRGPPRSRTASVPRPSAPCPA